MSAFRSMLVVVAGLALLIGSSRATATADPQYPVPYDLFVQDSVRDPYGSAAGSNDWNCVPSAAHPEPVVLLHGLGANRFNMFTTISPLLANEGYCVFAPTFGENASLPAPFDSVGGLGRLRGQRRRGWGIRRACSHCHRRAEGQHCWRFRGHPRWQLLRQILWRSARCG